MVGHFLKIQPNEEILESQDWKRGYETYRKKENFKSEINKL